MKLISPIIEKIKRKNMIMYAKQLGVKVGEDTKIAKNVIFDSEPYLIEIGNNTFVSNGVRFVTHDGGVYTLKKIHGLKDGGLPGIIRIGDNCYIGNNAVIMPNVIIGNNCVIGYGSIVTHDIPDNEVWAGIPAKRIESVDEYWEKNKARITVPPREYERKKEWLLNYFNLER